MNGQFPSTLLEKAVNEFAKLPGVGRKTAMSWFFTCSARIRQWWKRSAMPS